MSDVFFCDEFDLDDLDKDGKNLRENFDKIIKDLKENKYTNLGDTKLIKGDGDIKYFRAKLSISDRLLFTSIKHNNEDAFVILEVIPNHDYQKSKFLKDKEKIKNIKITDQNNEEVSDTVEVEDNPQVRWLGKFITLSTTQENIVKNAEDLPLIVSGSAGSGKTSVALEKFRKIEEKFEEGKVLYITKSKNLIKQSKELYEYVYWDETTNDFKIGIPDRIEFLSLHEFLEKQAENIKGKKPIDRNKFFSWFNEICKKDKFQEYKKDGDKIFEEFTAVIAGGGLKKEQYKELGKRQAIFSKEERDNIYSLFETYKEFIEEDSKYYDPNLIAHECTEEKVYDAVVIDEVQDLTESTLDLILKSLKDESKGNFLLCGDVNQVIHPSFFSKSRLKSFSSNYTTDKNLSIYNLQENYRNSQQVIDLANRVLHLKNYCFASEDKLKTDEEKEAFFMESDTKNVGNVNFITENKKQREIAEKVSGSTKWAVLVLDNESKEDARKLFNTPLVFNIHEAKGLEFENVILYKFMSCGAYNGVWNIAKKKIGETKTNEAIEKVRYSYDEKDVNPSRNKNQEDKSFEEYKFYMNALYVGVTRAMGSVCIMDKKHDLLKVIEPEKIVSVDIKQEESTLEAWRNEALRLIGEGKIEQAKGIVATKLSNNKEYAEEITKKLEAKEYHKEQASSKLKTGSIPISQGSSTSESRTPTKKARKYKNKKFQGEKRSNEEKKLTKEELEENTKELFSVLMSNNSEENSKKAKKLIEQGVDINAKHKEGYNPLHFAAHNGYDKAIELLLEHGANVNVSDQKSFTPLHFAVRRSHKDIVELLLQHKANVDAKTYEGITPLFLTAQKGHKDVAELLLKHEADINAQAKGATSLYIAAQEGHKDVAELLLQHKANVDARSKEDFTPLYVAAQKGHKDVAELLLQYEAKVNAKTQNGVTPLCVAAQLGHKDVTELLLQHEKIDVNTRDSNGLTSLHHAAGNGHSSIVKLLLDCGADIEADGGKFDTIFGTKLENVRGCTPLYCAAENGYDSVVTLLLERKAKVDATDARGLTPLYGAAANGHYSVVNLLLQGGAQVSVRSVQGHTLLHGAAKSGNDNVDVVKLLLNRGLKIDAMDDRGLTPLHGAAKSGNASIAEFLLDHGAPVDATDNPGLTPLHDAAVEGVENIVKLLLNRGADVNSRCKKDYTPLHGATNNGRDSVVKLLLKHGADVNAKSNDDKTPLLLELNRGYSEIVDLLLADPGINVGYVKPNFARDMTKNEKDKAKFFQKSTQDRKLFNKVKEAASEKDTDKLLKEIKELLESKTEHGFKPSLNYSPDGNDENTTIKIAIKAGGELLQCLYDYAANDQGWTLLHNSAQVGHVDITELLLKHKKIDVDAKDSNGCTPLYIAATFNHYDVVQIFLNNGADVNAKANLDCTPLHVAAQNGHDTVAQLLLDNGADIYAETHEGCTPLYFAAESGRTSVVQLLQDNGADISKCSKKGATPLHIAAEFNHLDVVQLLLKYKADVKMNNNNGCTTLHVAAQHGHDDVVRLLLDNGADIYARASGKDLTALHYAADRGHDGVVKLLLQREADVSARGGMGYTPLHVAAQNGYKRVAELLLEYKAKVDDANKNGYTALHIAAEFNRFDIAKLLLQHGADVNAKSNDGTMPLALALEKGNSKVVDLLLADPNINTGCIDLTSISNKKEDKRKLVQKRTQDQILFREVKEAASEKDAGKLDKLLKNVEESLCSKTEHDFKPSLNYSPDGNDKNTTIEIAINADGKLLRLLYDYAKKNIGTDTEIFKRLKQAIEQEKPQSKLDSSIVSCSSNQGLSGG